MSAVASFQGPNRIVVVPVLEDVELFRVVNVERPHHPGLVLDLTSNYERQARPRRVERFYAVLHMAVSTFTTREAACQLVARFPGIGTHVARLRLPGRAGSASTCRRRARIVHCGALPCNLRPVSWRWSRRRPRTRRSLPSSTTP